MKLFNRFMALAAILVLTHLPLRASPVAATELIDFVALPGSETVLVFPNIFDPVADKELSFIGWAEVAPGGGTFSVLDIRFDWLGLSGLPEYSPYTSIVVPAGAPVPIELHFRLPFCPQQVSLDVVNVDLVTPVHIKGEFSHCCLIDTPDAIGLTPSLALLGLLSLHALRRRKA